jgi:Cof subfamily protein (haloacid dehalogenase superfamily)
MAIELIAIDMDGTLLDPQHEISPRTRAAITAARERGVHVVLATGRPFAGVRRYLAELDLQHPGHYCITNNGALVQHAHDGSHVAAAMLDFGDYLHFEKMSRELGVHFQALDEHTLYTANADISRYTVREAFLSQIPLKFRAVAQMDPGLAFPKVMMIDEPALLDRALERMPAETFERYTIMKSTPYFLEILSRRADKGKGVKLLAEHLGIPAQNVMALGDQQNDLAMIGYAGLGVAMGNAIAQVKSASSYVTGSNAEDGVAQAIERFVVDA